jgi:hypothetical protein
MAFLVAGFAERPAPIELCDPDADRFAFDVVSVEKFAVPSEESFALRVTGLGHGLEELLESGDTSEVFGWRTTSTVDEAG